MNKLYKVNGVVSDWYNEFPAVMQHYVIAANEEEACKLFATKYTDETKKCYACNIRAYEIVTSKEEI